MSYDVVCGLSQTAINRVISEVFTRNLADYRGQLGSVQFTLPPPSVFIHAAAGAPQATGQGSFDYVLVTNLTFGSDTSIPSVSITVNGTGSFQISNRVGNQYLEATLLDAKLLPTNNEHLTSLQVQNISPLLPGLVASLNNTFLAPIQIPALQYPWMLEIGTPLLAMEAQFLTSYSKLGQGEPQPLPAQDWPADGFFVGIDVAVLEAAMNLAVLFPLAPSIDFIWENAAGQASALLLPPTVTVNSDGSVNAAFLTQVSCKGNLTSAWLSKFSFSPTATATVNLTLWPTMINSQMCLVIKTPSIPTFDFDWTFPFNWLMGVSAVSDFVQKVADGLNAVLWRLIGKTLEFAPIPVFTAPTISYTIPYASNVEFAITQMTPSNRSGQLMLAYQLDVSSTIVAPGPKGTMVPPSTSS
jgi:hypothetical protein